MRTLATGTGTIPGYLQNQFSSEVKSFASQLANAIKGNHVELFGSVVPVEMPKGNLDDIVRKYTRIGKAYLQEEGFHGKRAESVAKYTFTNLLEKLMFELEK